MTRSPLIILAVCALAAVIALPAAAADPVVAKRVITEADGVTVLKISVSAANQSIYGITLADETGSIADIWVPKGWVGISSGDRVIFRAGDDPISSGETVAFRIVTTNGSAPLDITFRGQKTPIHAKQTL
jgi:hypothetical protein